MSHGPDPVAPPGVEFAAGPDRWPAVGQPTLADPGTRPALVVRWLGVVIILITTAAIMSSMSFAVQTKPTRVDDSIEGGPPALLARQATIDAGPEGFVPKAVRIAAIGVKAPVVKVGTDREGAMELPDDPRILGWWRGSARAGGAHGNVVIAGHVFQRDQGLGALWSLKAVEPGDRVVLAGTKDRQVKYEVTKVQATKKVDLDPTTIFKDSGPHTLVLVTCGGYNKVTDHYEDNVIVYARLL